jgi:preprotein translocase subunit Sss1
MESTRHRIKRKVKKPKTLMNTIKKRLKSDYHKSIILVVAILLAIISIIGYFVLSMPMPKATNSNASYEDEEKRLKRVMEEHQKKQR